MSYSLVIIQSSPEPSLLNDEDAKIETNSVFTDTPGGFSMVNKAEIPEMTDQEFHDLLGNTKQGNPNAKYEEEWKKVTGKYVVPSIGTRMHRGKPETC